MKLILTLVFCVATALANPTPLVEAETCQDALCIRADGCVCTSNASPLPVDETPQFVIITVDDSISAYVHSEFYGPLLFNRQNPDNKPVSGTFYVPHQYTDYEKVNDLYNRGFDIGVHSITKGTTDYWEQATVAEVVAEFDGQRRIVSKFANVPLEEIKGARSPHLILSGDVTLEAYKQSELEYDNSWPTRSDQQIFPYTLDYKSTQENPVGRRPTESYPGFWIIPIVNFEGTTGECNALFGCQVSGTPEEVRDWLVAEFDQTYTTNRAPISILLNSVWLEQPERENFEGFKLFLDEIQSRPGVYLVSHKEVVAWSKNPVGLSTYTTSTTTKTQACPAQTCPLKFGEFEVRYMRSCAPCPDIYPWLNNPDGNDEA